MENRSVCDLTVQELKRLKRQSLYLIQFGWLIGIVMILCGILSFLFALLVSKPEGGSRLMLVLPLAVGWIFLFTFFAGPRFYIYTRCRSGAARIFVHADTLIGAIFCAVQIATTLFMAINSDASAAHSVGYAVGSSLVPAILLAIYIILFRSARQKILWGDDRVGHEQLKFAYEMKKDGREFTVDPLPPRRESNRALTVISLVVAWLSEIWALISLLATVVESVKIVALILTT